MFGATHTAAVKRWGYAAPDAAGRSGREVTAQTNVKGRFAFLNSAEIEVAAKYGENAIAVFLVDRATDVQTSDTIVFDDVNDTVNDEWEVAGIEYAVIHLRIFLRRSKLDGS